MMSELQSLVHAQQEFFARGHTRAVSYRRAQLAHLERALRSHEPRLLAALQADLHKNESEARLTELYMLYEEIRHTRRHLARWARTRRVGMPPTLFPATGSVRREPYGVALIIAPWNYPLLLLISPLIAAIGAGNCAVLKPSELAPHTAAALQAMIDEAFPREYIALVQGEREVSTALLAQRFDTIFFTGSTQVGRVVMRAAAEHLTPVTLELGGKSPCIIDRHANLAIAARRVAWGKFINAGQTCVAPDYLLVHRAVKEPFLRALTGEIERMYGQAAFERMGRIINERHFDRLVGLMGTGRIVCGGQTQRQARYIAPTVIDDIGLDDPIMQEEIFGPLLPVLTYEDTQEAVSIIASRPKPLALYVFSQDRAVQERFLALPFGGGCVNDTILHLASSALPFGGVGESGMGAYHGKAGFDVFTHEKAILRKSTRVDVPLIYPPYEGIKKSLLRKVLR